MLVFFSLLSHQSKSKSGDHENNSKNTMPLEATDIQALATALQNLRPADATVNATAVKLPPFWSGNPEL
jgi:hypothetical protein